VNKEGMERRGEKHCGCFWCSENCSYWS